MPKLEPWRRNLFAIAAAQFIALGGGNLVFPFMPFYVKELGITDPDDVALWSGLLGTATGTMLFVFSPIWGSLADRFGRKQMLLRAYAGALVVVTLQGFVQNVWQLAALRALQGMFVGTIPAATALVASSTPRDRVAYGLGVVQMALFSSQFAGPLAGGALAASVGFRPTFVLAGGGYLLSFLFVHSFVEEKFERPSRAERETFFGNLRAVLNERQLALLIAIVFFLNAAPSFIRPLIPLRLEALDPGADPATLAGFAFAALAITSAGAALFSSRLGGRAGYRNALALATIGAGAAYLPLALAGNAPSFILLIAVVGLFSGGMVPMANALIDARTPPGRQASAFGLAGSAMALAFAIAPLSGGVVASAAGVPASFVVVALVMICVGLGVLALVREKTEAAVVAQPGPAGGGE